MALLSAALASRPEAQGGHGLSGQVLPGKGGLLGHPWPRGAGLGLTSLRSDTGKAPCSAPGNRGRLRDAPCSQAPAGTPSASFSWGTLPKRTGPGATRPRDSGAPSPTPGRQTLPPALGRWGRGAGGYECTRSFPALSEAPLASPSLSASLGPGSWLAQCPHMLSLHTHVAETTGLNSYGDLLSAPPQRSMTPRARDKGTR